MNSVLGVDGQPSVIDCLCYEPPDTDPPPYTLSLCNFTCADPRIPIACGLELPFTGYPFSGSAVLREDISVTDVESVLDIIEQTAAVYHFNASVAAMSCERLCQLNVSSPCHVDHTSEDCINLIAGCYDGRENATAASCWNPSLAYISDNVFDNERFKQLTYNFFIRVANTALNLHLVVVEPSGIMESDEVPLLLSDTERPTPLSCGTTAAGLIFRPGSQLEALNGTIIATQAEAWYPRPSGTSSPYVEPSLRLRNTYTQRGHYEHCGIIYLADYPVNFTNCRYYKFFVDGGSYPTNPLYQLEEHHLDTPECSDTPYFWQFAFMPSGTGDGVLRQWETYSLYNLTYGGYENRDFDIVASPRNGVMDGSNGLGTLCHTMSTRDPNTPIHIASEADKVSWQNCYNYTAPLFLLVSDIRNYVGFFTYTKQFGRLYDYVPAPALAVAAGTFSSNLSTIEFIFVLERTGIDLGNAINVTVTGDLAINGGFPPTSINLFPVQRIDGTLGLMGDNSLTVMPSAAYLPSVRLTSYSSGSYWSPYTKTGWITSESVGHLEISASINYLAPWPQSIASIELDIPPMGSMNLPPFPYRTLQNLTLTQAGLITNSLFPNLTTVTNLIIGNVATFVWDPSAPILSVVNLAVTDGPSLDGLRLSVTGSIVIDGSQLIDLTLLSSVTSLSGSLIITNNPVLASLTGLENLVSVGGDVIIEGNSPLLNNIEPLTNLCSVGGSIRISYGENNLNQFASAFQPCSCTRTGFFCNCPLEPSFANMYPLTQYFVNAGDVEDSTDYMAQGLLCAKSISTNGSEQVQLVAAVVANITALSNNRGPGWNVIAYDALIFYMTQLQGPSSTTFVPMASTVDLLSRMDLFVQAYATAEDQYEEMVTNSAQREAILQWRNQQLSRASTLSTQMSNNLNLYINERDAAIDQMVKAGAHVDATIEDLDAQFAIVLSNLEAASSPKARVFGILKACLGELGNIGTAMLDLADDTSNTRRSEPVERASTAPGVFIWKAIMKAAIKLAQIVVNIVKASQEATEAWESADDAMDDLEQVMDYLTDLVTFIDELELQIVLVADGGSVANLTAALEAGNFGTPADWAVLPLSMKFALTDGLICYSTETRAENIDACAQISLLMEILAIWGGQITNLATVVTELEREIATLSMAQLQVVTYNKQVTELVVGAGEMSEQAIQQTLFYAAQYMATLASVALVQLQQLCASLDYYAPYEERELSSCDVAHLYVGMSSRELQRRLSLITFAYAAAARERQSSRESFIEKVDVTGLIDGGNLTNFLNGSSVTVSITPALFPFGPLAAGQNAEWKYLFVQLDPVPATAGIRNAPPVDLTIALQSPFLKLERYVDSSIVNHTYTLWGLHVNYAYYSKANSTSTAACAASVTVPGNLADDICQAGITDGYFSVTKQLPAVFGTLVLTIANLPELLAYHPAFLANVTNVYIGGIAVTNPRAHPMPITRNVTEVSF